MYAVIEAYGRQYRVKEGERIQVLGDVPAEGGAVRLDRVLLCSGKEGLRVGTPYLAGVWVEGKVGAARRLPRVTGMKFRRRKNSRVKKAFRQREFDILIQQIHEDGGA